jgi:hypothetical protein
VGEHRQECGGVLDPFSQLPARIGVINMCYPADELMHRVSDRLEGGRPRTQRSWRRATDGCIARMMRKPNRPTATSDAALLLLKGIGLLVRHGSSTAGWRLRRPNRGTTDRRSATDNAARTRQVRRQGGDLRVPARPISLSPSTAQRGSCRPGRTGSPRSGRRRYVPPMQKYRADTRAGKRQSLGLDPLAATSGSSDPGPMLPVE